ncbi:MAG: FecR family protein [Bacteroidetes bacterium]|nr:FecR family protein [Bacteroidota bacterium]
MKSDLFEIDDLIIRYLSGATSPEENSILSSWIKESADNQSYFNSIRNIWLATSQTNHVVSINTINPDIIKRGDADAEDAFDDEDDSEEELANRPSVFIRIIRVAAVVLIALTIGALGNQYWINNHQIAFTDRKMNIETTLGSRAVTTLPDGSRVWLNAGSRLDYNLDFGQKTRIVKLIGEAFFDVKTDSSKPFVVKAGKLAIKAYGTAFNVKAYPEENSITTTLVRGKVVIAGKDNSDKDFAINLKPNDKVAFYNDNSQRINALNKVHDLNNQAQQSVPVLLKDINAVKEAEIKTELYTSWKDERWVIEKRDIESLLSDFERRYNIKIQIGSDEIKKYHFTGTLQNETIEQVLVILRHTIPLKYKVEKGLITISEDERLEKEFKSANINIEN